MRGVSNGKRAESQAMDKRRGKSRGPDKLHDIAQKRTLRSSGPIWSTAVHKCWGRGAAIKEGEEREEQGGEFESDDQDY